MCLTPKMCGIFGWHTHENTYSSSDCWFKYAHSTKTVDVICAWGWNIFEPRATTSFSEASLHINLLFFCVCVCKTQKTDFRSSSMPLTYCISPQPSYISRSQNCMTLKHNLLNFIKKRTQCWCIQPVNSLLQWNKKLTTKNVQKKATYTAPCVYNMRSLKVN